MKITPEEISSFIESNNLVFEQVDSPIGQIYALVSGSINHNDPYESFALNVCLWAYNGVDEIYCKND